MAKTNVADVQQDNAQEVKLVKMNRSESYEEPYDADVHPDEVENYKSGGWVVAE